MAIYILFVLNTRISCKVMEINVSSYKLNENWSSGSRGAHKGGCRAEAPPPNTQKPKLKKKLYFMISKVLCDLPFSRNQPLKSVDD
jgi:hypothetical protein